MVCKNITAKDTAATASCITYTTKSPRNGACVCRLWPHSRPDRLVLQVYTTTGWSRLAYTETVDVVVDFLNDVDDWIDFRDISDEAIWHAFREFCETYITGWEQTHESFCALELI